MKKQKNSILSNMDREMKHINTTELKVRYLNSNDLLIRETRSKADLLTKKLDVYQAIYSHLEFILQRIGYLLIPIRKKIFLRGCYASSVCAHLSCHCSTIIILKFHIIIFTNFNLKQSTVTYQEFRGV